MYPKDKIPQNEVIKFIFIFYTVGLLGFFIPFSRDIFIKITPFALLINLYLLAVYHSSFTRKNSLIFTLIFLIGFFIEVIGVQTGRIFGHYQYDLGLGLKLWDTPLLIGANWLFLSYVSCASIRSLRLTQGLKLIVAPSLMLGYDLVLEQVAPHMRMWHWENNSIPIQNYIAWWLIALITTSLIQAFKVNTNNPLAKPLFLAQWFFFIILMFVFKA